MNQLLFDVYFCRPVDACIYSIDFKPGIWLELGHGGRGWEALRKGKALCFTDRIMALILITDLYVISYRN